MKAVDINTMKMLDARAITGVGISSIVLMENAGLRAADIIDAQYGKSKRNTVVIICGRGNNGGDGLVIARHLMNKDHTVKIFMLAAREAITGDSRVNLTIIENMQSDVTFTGGAQPDITFRQSLARCDLIVDAIFGTGLDRTITAPISDYISVMNESGKPIVAIDAPSGINCDSGKVLGVAVKAHSTITMAVAKKGFYLNDGPSYTGEVHVVDIGIPRTLIDE